MLHIIILYFYNYSYYNYSNIFPYIIFLECTRYTNFNLGGEIWVPRETHWYVYTYGNYEQWKWINDTDQYATGWYTESYRRWWVEDFSYVQKRIWFNVQIFSGLRVRYQIQRNRSTRIYNVCTCWTVRHKILLESKEGQIFFTLRKNVLSLETRSSIILHVYSIYVYNKQFLGTKTECRNEHIATLLIVSSIFLLYKDVSYSYDY